VDPQERGEGLMDAETKQQFENLTALVNDMRGQNQSLAALVHDTHDSVVREVGEVKEMLDRMNVRLDKIAAGSHYVSKLAVWSDKQDEFQLDILRRVQAIERRLDIKPEDKP
jgi:hypothetical protein